jgi:Flp pilus assembly protein TadD
MTSADIAPIFEMATKCHAQGQFDQAIALYRQVLTARPDFAPAANNLAKALHDCGDFPEAVAACRQFQALRPNDPQALSNLALTLLANGQADEAIAALQSALKLQPNLPQIYHHLAEALCHTGQIDDAIAAAKEAVRLAPNFPQAHLKLGELLLLTGDFSNGWTEYEWRYKVVIKDPTAHSQYMQAMWDGGNLNGQRIILGCEGGFGDVMQFCRYAPMVAHRGGKVLLGSPPELLRLLKSLNGVEQVVPAGQPPPNCDIHCPMINLAKMFGTTLQTIPAKIPYLFADPTLSGQWAVRLAQYADRLKVGIVWAGNPKNRYDRSRSLVLGQFAPLAGISKLTLFSLQKGPASTHAAQPPAGLSMVDWTAELNDFAETAALIANLDLVVAVDSAVVHLAGAMGKPTWVLVPSLQDWRWLLNRTDSPWYPSARLFRQQKPGNWQKPIGELAQALQSLQRR